MHGRRWQYVRNAGASGGVWGEVLPRSRCSGRDWAPRHVQSTAGFCRNNSPSERALCIGETADASNVAIDPCICILVPRQTFINTVF